MINFAKKLKFGERAEKRVIASSLVLAGVLLLADQLTKVLVENHIPLGDRIVVVPRFFNLTHITNKGAAWGILQGYGWLLLLIACCVVLLVLFNLRWLTEGFTERYFALLLMTGGVIGNSIDRIWRGAVVDFLDFYVGEAHWPAFNLADSAICVGVTIFLLSSLLRRPPSASAADGSPCSGKHDNA